MKKCERCVIKKSFNKLEQYEDICDEPSKLEQIDKLYLEKCEEVNKLKDTITKLEEINQRLVDNQE